MNYPNEIDRFTNEYEFLSNFYPSPVFLDDLNERRIHYKTVEHAYQASKTLDPDERYMIKRKHTPGQAKRAGQLIQLREDWEDIKVDIMYRLVFRKFMHTKDIRDKLLKTGKAVLIEGNYWNDKFWGVCLKTKEGENNLGKILMWARETIRHNIGNTIWLRRALNA